MSPPDRAAEGPIEALASFFVIPAKSGVYLTKSELIVLARVSEASLRVSDRRRMLADVLKSAQSTEELAAMVGRLADFCRVHLAEYEALAARYPATQPLFAPWVEKALATVKRLEAIGEELALAGPPPITSPSSS